MNWKDSRYMRALIKGAFLIVSACLFVGGIVTLLIYRIDSYKPALWCCVGMLSIGTLTLLTYVASETIRGKGKGKTRS